MAAANSQNSDTGRRPPFPKWLVILALAVLVGCIMWPKINWRYVGDWFASLGYEPSSEIAAIETSLGLTDYATVVFRASQPVLEDNAAFNEHCESGDVAVSIVGCYNNGVIYLYNIDTDGNGLAGIIESTAAHELLHALWERLSTDEQNELTSALESVYADHADHADQLGDELALYEEDARLEELYARAATEIKDLPETLETHYARYFNDQDALVDYYTAFHSTFAEMQAELDTLTAELDTLNTEIEDLRAQIDQQAELGNIDYANYLVNLANQKIVTYNQLVEEYNQNILRSQELNAAVNSNL